MPVDNHIDNPSDKDPGDHHRSLVIRMLGPFTVEVHGKRLPTMRSRKDSWLLALLVLEQVGGRGPVSREWLAQTLWPFPDFSVDLTRGYLRRAVWQLGKALGDQKYRLRSTVHTLELDLDGADVDVLRFDTAISRGDQKSLEEALRLYHGPLLSECTESWIEQERAKRAFAFRDTLVALAEAATTAGKLEAAIDYWRRAIAVDFSWEYAQRGLLKSLAAIGAYNAAFQAYNEFRRRLYQEYGRVPDPATAEVFQQVREASRRDLEPEDKTSESDPEDISSSIHPRFGRLPDYPTDLLGRETERAEVTRRLKHRRLVTLTGPGGIGKTRLAVQAAADLRPDYADGVCFVDLADISEPDFVTSAFVSALAITGTAPKSDTIDVLIHFLSQKSLLVVLDNCEHLVRACAELVQNVLIDCPNIRFLVTSRQALGVKGETAWCIPSLPVPDLEPEPTDPAESDGDPEELMIRALRFPAVELFFQAGSEVQSLIKTSPSTIRTIIRICQRLDGIPLAIELAAAQLRMLSPSDLLERIEDQFRMLGIGQSDRPARHRTLGTTIQWSWDLLEEDMRQSLVQLLVFRGSFTLAAVEQICPGIHSGDGTAKGDAYFWLEQFVDRSLVSVVMSRGRSRYRLLTPIRDFCLQRLNRALDSPAVEALQDRHAAWYVHWVQQEQHRQVGEEQGQWLDDIEIDYPNIRAALQRVLVAADGAAALQLCGGIWRFWYLRGHMTEGLEWLEQTLLISEQMDPDLLRSVLTSAGNMAYTRGDYPKARRYFGQALAICQDLKNLRGIAVSLGSLANIARDEQCFPEALSLFQESLEIFQQLNDARGVALTLANLPLVHFQLGDFPLAAKLHEESIQMFREQGDVYHLALGLSNMGHTLLYTDQIEKVRPLLEESLTLNLKLRSSPGIARCLILFALLAMKQHSYRRAATLLGAQDALRDRIDYPLAPHAIGEYDHTRAVLRERLGEARFQARISAGRTMTTEEAITLARSQKPSKEVPPELPEDFG